MALQYYINRNDKVRGPFSEERLRELHAEGKLRETDFVSTRSDGGWKPAMSVLNQRSSARKPSPKKTASRVAVSSPNSRKWIWIAGGSCLLIPVAIGVVFLLLPAKPEPLIIAESAPAATQPPIPEPPSAAPLVPQTRVYQPGESFMVVRGTEKTEISQRSNNPAGRIIGVLLDYLSDDLGFAVTLDFIATADCGIELPAETLTLTIAPPKKPFFANTGDEVSVIAQLTDEGLALEVTKAFVRIIRGPQLTDGKILHFGDSNEANGKMFAALHAAKDSGDFSKLQGEIEFNQARRKERKEARDRRYESQAKIHETHFGYDHTGFSRMAIFITEMQLIQTKASVLFDDALLMAVFDILANPLKAITPTSDLTSIPDSSTSLAESTPNSRVDALDRSIALTPKPPKNLDELFEQEPQLKHYVDSIADSGEQATFKVALGELLEFSNPTQPFGDFLADKNNCILIGRLISDDSIVRNVIAERPLVIFKGGYFIVLANTKHEDVTFFHPEMTPVRIALTNLNESRFATLGEHSMTRIPDSALTAIDLRPVDAEGNQITAEVKIDVDSSEFRYYRAVFGMGFRTAKQLDWFGLKIQTNFVSSVDGLAQLRIAPFTYLVTVEMPNFHDVAIRVRPSAFAEGDVHLGDVSLYPRLNFEVEHVISSSGQFAGLPIATDRATPNSGYSSMIGQVPVSVVQSEGFLRHAIFEQSGTDILVRADGIESVAELGTEPIESYLNVDPTTVAFESTWLHIRRDMIGVDAFEREKSAFKDESSFARSIAHSSQEVGGPPVFRSDDKTRSTRLRLKPGMVYMAKLRSPFTSIFRISDPIPEREFKVRKFGEWYPDLEASVAKINGQIKEIDVASGEERMISIEFRNASNATDEVRKQAMEEIFQQLPNVTSRLELLLGNTRDVYTKSMLLGLGSQKKLETVTLPESCVAVIDDDCCRAFASLGQLRHLSICGNAITDEGVKAISKIKSLTNLTISFTKVSKNGLKALSSLPELKSLSLQHESLNDDALVALENHPTLQSLTFYDCPAITARSISVFKSIRNLESLELHMTGMSTAAATRSLRRSQPNLYVGYSMTERERWLVLMLKQAIPPLDFPGAVPVSEPLLRISKHFTNVYGNSGGQYEMEIIGDASSLKKVGIGSIDEIRISDMKLGRIQLREAFRKILDKVDQAKLDYEIRDGKIYITAEKPK